MSNWIAAKASVIGASHKQTGQPCQDAHVVSLEGSDEWLVMVVCDGAGSASRSDEGAQHVSKYFAKELASLVAELESRAPGAWINDFIISKIVEVRRQLEELAGSDEVRELNCTLVACLVGKNGGFTFHIGDGNIIGGYREEGVRNSSYKIFQSLPENGEYANETFFITEKDWVKHLRVTPIPSLDWVLCCSDGGASLALENEKTIKEGFLIPVVESVFKQEDQAQRDLRLRQYLEDPQADAVTGDDKTLAIAFKSSAIKTTKEYLVRARQEGSDPLSHEQRMSQNKGSKSRTISHPEVTRRLNPQVFKTKKRIALLAAFVGSLIAVVGLSLYFLLPQKSAQSDDIFTQFYSGYIGEMKAGSKHGHGTFYYENDEVYVGQWENDKPQGFGVYRNSDGSLYIGRWEDGRKTGPGALYGSNYRLFIESETE